MAGVPFGVGDILEGKNEEDDYFKILGCSETSTDEQITAEYRVRALQCHPDKHPGDKLALDRFQRLQEARDTLLDPEKRQKYDRWRQSQICIPYKQWLGMSNRCATTMHWAKPKDQTMIQSASEQKRVDLEKEFYSSDPPHQSTSVADVKWSASSSTGRQHNAWKPEKANSIYAKFRDYKI